MYLPGIFPQDLNHILFDFRVVVNSPEKKQGPMICIYFNIRISLIYYAILSPHCERASSEVQKRLETSLR